MSFDRDIGRYEEVQTENGKSFHVKRSNLQSEVTVGCLSIRDLKAILMYQNKQAFVDSCFEDKSELEATVLELALSSG